MPLERCRQIRSAREIATQSWRANPPALDASCARHQKADMVFVPPEPSWNALVLVLNCGGGDAARRLADNRDSLSAIRDFIKFAPDWKALEVSLGTPQRREYRFCKPVYMTEFPGITAAIVVEYARFLRLFEGMPHKSIAPPPNWPTLLHDNPATPRGPPTSQVLKKIWEFHSKQDSYAEDSGTFRR